MISLIALLTSLNTSPTENANPLNYRLDYFVYFQGMNTSIFRKDIAGGVGSTINFGTENSLYGIGCMLGTSNLNRDDKNSYRTFGGITKYSYVYGALYPTCGFAFNMIDVTNNQFKYSGCLFLGIDMVSSPKQSKTGHFLGINFLLNPGPNNAGIGAQIYGGFSLF